MACSFVNEIQSLSGGKVMKVFVTLILAFGLLGLFLPGQVGAQCSDYGNTLGWVGSIIDDGGGYNLDIQGDYAYIAGWSVQFHYSYPAFFIVDISIPNNPVFVSKFRAMYGGDVAVQGNYAYVAGLVLYGGVFGLMVVDITDPENPIKVGYFIENCQFNNIVIQGDYAFATGDYGLHVINISDPEIPVLVRKIETRINSTESIVQDDFAYVTDGASLLKIDISSPETSVIVGDIGISVGNNKIPNSALDMVIESGFVYIVDGTSLYIINNSDPGRMELVASFETSVSAQCLEIQGESVFVYGSLEGNGAFQKINISNPENPVSVEINREPTLHLPITDVAITDEYSYVVTNNDFLMVALDHNMSLEIVEPLGSLDLVGDSKAIAAQGNFAYILSTDTGLFVVDISSPELPTVLGNNPDVIGNISGIAVQGDYAYAAFRDYGLKVINVAVPELPLIIEEVTELGGVYGVAVQGSYAFVLCHQEIHILDISSPEDPEQAGVFPGNFTDIDVQGDYAYAFDGSNLQVLDITIPSLPVLVGDIDDFGRNVTVQGNYAYSTYWTIPGWGAPAFGGIVIADISVPESPVIVGRCPTPKPFSQTSIVLDGDFAYVTEAGLTLVIDISTPESPVLFGGIELEEPLSLALAEIGICVADRSRGLVIIPFQCDGTTGMEEYITDLETTETPQPLANLFVHPNPFNPLTTISFSIDHLQKVELCIFDMTGKRIAILADRAFEAGVHSLDWQGIDLQGRAVASGTYLLRMSTEERVTSKKMMLVR